MSTGGSKFETEGCRLSLGLISLAVSSSTVDSALVENIAAC